MQKLEGTASRSPATRQKSVNDHGDNGRQRTSLLCGGENRVISRRTARGQASGRGAAGGGGGAGGGSRNAGLVIPVSGPEGLGSGNP